ncbi:MAG: ArnT family glycosyltransferase [Syntrophobacteraceae bacterium]
MATCLGHYAFTRIFSPDLILSFFIAFSLYCYALITIEEVKPISIGPIDLWCAALYISAALALLTKGLIGLIFPGATIFIHILVTGNCKILRRLQIGYGAIIFLIVAAPWHVAAALANADFMWFYFIREHVLRFLEKRYPKDSGSLSTLAFWGLGLLWLFPWSAFLWGLVGSFPKSVWAREKTEQACLLLFIWIGVVLAFFTVGTAQEYYSFPCLAAFALLLGKTLEDLDTGRISPKIGTIGIGTMAVLTLWTGFAMIALRFIGGDGQALTLSATLITNPERFLAIDRLRDLTPATFSRLAPLVCRTAALLIVGPLVALLFAMRKRWMVSFLFLSVMMIGLCRMYNAGMVAFEARLGSKNLAEVILQNYRQGDKIVINDFYEKGASLNYYTGLQVYVLNGSVGVLWYGLQDKAAPRLAVTEEELLNQWKSANRIFLFSKEKPLESFIARHPDFSYRILAEAGGKKVLVNW